MENFHVSIIEVLKETVIVEADDPHLAEQIVFGRWKNGDYILNADNFTGVEVTATPVN